MRQLCVQRNITRHITTLMSASQFKTDLMMWSDYIFVVLYALHIHLLHNQPNFLIQRTFMYLNLWSCFSNYTLKHIWSSPPKIYQQFEVISLQNSTSVYLFAQAWHGQVSLPNHTLYKDCIRYIATHSTIPNNLGNAI